MTDPKFTFIPLPKKVSQTLTDKDNQQNLLQWGFKGNLKVKYYNFNQDFKIHDKQDFAESFFQDPSVYLSMEVQNSSNVWVPIGFPAENIEYQTVPCSEVSMKFFDRLKNEDNGIVRCGYLTECMDEFVDGLLLQDNLRQMLVIVDHQAYQLYDDYEKQQFLFLIFKHLALGGAYCQRSAVIQPYLDMTKSLYKELISVDKVERTNELRVRSIVLKVTAKSKLGAPIAPSLEPDHPQNFIYLVIDPLKRQVAVLYHQFGGYVME